jgi:hypothetical protein
MGGFGTDGEEIGFWTRKKTKEHREKRIEIRKRLRNQESSFKNQEKKVFVN